MYWHATVEIKLPRQIASIHPHVLNECIFYERQAIFCERQTIFFQSDMIEKDSSRRNASYLTHQLSKHRNGFRHPNDIQLSLKEKLFTSKKCHSLKSAKLWYLMMPKSSVINYRFRPVLRTMSKLYDGINIGETKASTSPGRDPEGR